MAYWRMPLKSSRVTIFAPSNVLSSSLNENCSCFGITFCVIELLSFGRGVSARCVGSIRLAKRSAELETKV